MSTTQQTAVTLPPELPVGGQVMAIVPQTFTEVQRIANTVIASGIAPQALIYKPKADDDPAWVKQRNIAAVATVLMAGAELGVPPMAALRLFTVINGRPALYADGNVAVVRKAKDQDGKRICAYINSGFEIIRTPAGEIDDASFGWCESKRLDNDETHREEFSIDDAKRAGLWSPDALVEREVWEGPSGSRRKVTRMVPNDAPWHRYFKRMATWRATGYCLRWLYADVLGGMLDEFEVREISGMVDITPPALRQTMSPPSPPADDDVPEPASSPVETEDDAEAEQEPKPDLPSPDANGGAAHASKVATPPAPPPEDAAPDTSEGGRFLSDIDQTLAAIHDMDALEQSWDGFDVQIAFADDEAALQDAFNIKARHEARVRRELAVANGQQSMFEDDMPEATRAAVRNMRTP